MQTGRIDFGTPTSRAMGRMTTILFRPFDAGKWFVLGFTAWLAALMEGGGGSGGGGSPGDVAGPGTTGESDPSEDIFAPALDYWQSNSHWIIPVAIGVIVLILAFFIVLLWVSSRGKFMLLDNVVYNRALVVQPWKEFKDVANSLFWWRLGFSIVAMMIFLGVGGVSAFFLFTYFEPENLQTEWIAGAISAVLLILILLLIMSYIIVLLEDFVIPMMYKHSLPTSGAWRQFLFLHGANRSRFILYFLWRALLQLASGIIIITVIVITCCIAGCLMAIPYLGAVIVLPVTVFFRALGPEFVRQFGDDYDLWEGSLDLYGFEPGPGSEPPSGPSEAPPSGPSDAPPPPWAQR